MTHTEETAVLISVAQHEVADTFATSKPGKERRAREFAIPFYIEFAGSANEKRPARRERAAQEFVQPQLPQFLLTAMAVAEQHKTRLAH